MHISSKISSVTPRSMGRNDRLLPIHDLGKESEKGAGYACMDAAWWRRALVLSLSPFILWRAEDH
jgi:hypothetical protein